MTDFLEFLNNAESTAIEELPGVTAAMAEKIAAGRPFASLEDCAKAAGLSAKKMDKVKTDYEKSLEPIEEEPLRVERVEEEPARKNVAGRVIGWIVVLLLLAGAVYAAIRWGIPFVYDRYIKPVEVNTAELTDLASQQSSDVAGLNDRIAALEAHVNTLEARADGFDESLTTHDETLQQLENMQRLMDQQIATQKTDLLAELETRITLTRAIELISRSRLYLSDSNYGLAKEDLLSARELLYPLLEALPGDQVGALKTVITRIDMALSNLPAYPVVAVYDVDTAWQYLVDGLPNVPEQAVEPLVMPTAEATEPAEDNDKVEPTAEPTAEPVAEETAAP